MVAIRYPILVAHHRDHASQLKMNIQLGVKSPSLTAPILAKKSRKLVLRPVDASLSAGDEVDLKKRPSSRVVHKETIPHKMGKTSVNLTSDWGRNGIRAKSWQ
jgi:hypothetical protein